MQQLDRAPHSKQETGEGKQQHNCKSQKKVATQALPEASPKETLCCISAVIQCILPKFFRNCYAKQQSQPMVQQEGKKYVSSTQKNQPGLEKLSGVPPGLVEGVAVHNRDRDGI